MAAKKRASENEREENNGNQNHDHPPHQEQNFFEGFDPFNPHQGFNSMFKNFAKMKVPGMDALDKDTFMNNQRQNMEAISDANKMAVEVMRSLANLQSQYMRQTFDDFGNMMREAMANPASPENVNRQNEALQKTMKRTMEYSTNMGDILVGSGQQIAGKAQNHIQDNVNLFNNIVSKYKN